MSTKKLSNLDHIEGKDTGEMRYLKQARGDGSGYVFRMVTPEKLRGRENPWTGKPFGNEIKKGLNTRHRPTARQRRDVILGEIRALEMGAEAADGFTMQSALAWREEIAAAREADPTGHEAEILALTLSGRLEKEEEGRDAPPTKTLRRFARVAQGSGFPLSEAVPQYIRERSPDNPFGFKPLKRATVKEVEIAVSHLRDFLVDTEDAACLEDVTPKLARSFRQDYLPSITSKKTKEPMAARTAEKYVTMLRKLWDWAISDRELTSAKYRSNPWDFGCSIPRDRKRDEGVREAFTASEVQALLAPKPRGTREGDAFRLALATGARINELVLLEVADVEPDASGLYIREGKSSNAARFVPLVGDARALMGARLSAHGQTGRVFPEWPIKPSTGTCGAVTRWFIDFRRKILGEESEGRVTLHSTRHTWRTAARRAGVAEPDVNDLGGWAGPKTSNSVYDHGLLKEQLEEAQEQIWQELERSDYLIGF
ncbi:MAG: tyrosine-type recombinase/integrase [Maritimibacter sp.]|uniref:tyrosine-type recombinase/integrase n=1 Tax=Maritimibacter sp. TaxID=2003363 RepID=UPI001DD2B2C5|nr:tyrosine-type recombinase/integrase [Maritimibacter sp.]MBL6426701.1 tyrosine-type recombinase/integrase [Maritimibacter sp.]